MGGEGWARAGDLETDRMTGAAFNGFSNAAETLGGDRDGLWLTARADALCCCLPVGNACSWRGEACETDCLPLMGTSRSSMSLSSSDCARS